ncbi:MAG: glycosyltransferase [Lachnospiraceae bacterium]|nr:glycosyltransferase [Lachnospiraceae bacterium]
MDSKDLKISIVTVTFDSAATFEDTIRSVLSQTYLPFEYIVIDGGSTDATLSIIEGHRSEFEKKGIGLTVVSESDNGIYDAMNKGTKLASGDVVGIINSDDWYENDALETVANAYAESPFDLFYADIRMVLPDGKSFVKHSRDRKYATSRDWNHPTTFITKDKYNRYEYRTDTIHDDYDLILRIKRDGARIAVVNKVIANFRMNGTSHRRSIAAALSSIKIKYGIYRRNGYSRFYLFECLLVEAGKLIIG